MLPEIQAYLDKHPEFGPPRDSVEEFTYHIEVITADCLCPCEATAQYNPPYDRDDGTLTGYELSPLLDVVTIPAGDLQGEAARAIAEQFLVWSSRFQRAALEIISRYPPADTPESYQASTPRL